MTARETASLHRVRDALVGARPITDLTDAEGRVFNAEIDARISQSLATADYLSVLAARGVTTVVLYDEGRIMEHHPDGTTYVLDDE